MKKRRLVPCNGKYHVILPSKWVKAVGIEEGDEVTLKIDDDDIHKLIIRLVKKIVNEYINSIHYPSDSK